jgi:hypothetical protein
LGSARERRGWRGNAPSLLTRTRNVRAPCVDGEGANPLSCHANGMYSNLPLGEGYFIFMRPYIPWTLLAPPPGAAYSNRGCCTERPATSLMPRDCCTEQILKPPLRGGVAARRYSNNNLNCKIHLMSLIGVTSLLSCAHEMCRKLPLAKGCRNALSCHARTQCAPTSFTGGLL